MNYFYDLPIEIQCLIYEKCGKSEWVENIEPVNKQIQNKKQDDFVKLLFKSRTDINSLWKLRNF